MIFRPEAVVLSFQTNKMKELFSQLDTLDSRGAVLLSFWYQPEPAQTNGCCCVSEGETVRNSSGPQIKDTQPKWMNIYI